MEVASHLHMSIQKCQEETSSTQFMDWQVYLEMEVNTFHRIDFYLAQVCLTIAQVFGGKKAKNLQVKDFLLKFKKENEKESIQMTEEQKLIVTKQRWFRRVGYIPKKKKRY